MSPKPLLLPLLLCACAPEPTVLTATGSFQGLVAEDFEERGQGEKRRLSLALASLEESALVELVLGPETEARCWRTKKSQHGCTRRGEAGLVEKALFRKAEESCELEAWVEKLDDTWQLELSAPETQRCEEGRFSAVIIR